MKSLIQNAVKSLLRRHSSSHVEEFTTPYVIQRNVEGVTFQLHIRDHHARMWYDLHNTDPVWVEMGFIRDNLIEPGDTVIECGSHHGVTTIMLSQWVGPQGKVYAYEPGAHNYEVLRQNLALNRVANVNPIKAAVGSANGFVEFHEDPEHSMGAKVVPEIHRGADPVAQSVSQVSLAIHEPERPALVKIDTQGYVYQTLLGLKDIIRKQKPNLALEIDAKNVIDEYGDNFDKIFDLIQHDDYVYFAQFSETDRPQQIELWSVVPEWNRRNALSDEIHLYAKRRTAP